MNILFVTSWYPSKLDPTNGNFVERHALALISQGHHVRIVHEGFSHRILFPSLEREIVAGIEIFHLYLPRSLKGQIGVRKAIARRFLKRLHISGLGVDIVHGQIFYPVGPLAVFLSESLKVPLVFTEHWSGYLPSNADKLAPDLIRNTRSVVSRCACVMPVSEQLQSAMQDLGFQGNYEVVFNAVDANLFFPISEKEKKGFTFLHVSTFAAVKNVEGILRAFAVFQHKNPNLEANLQVVGDGDLLSLKNFIESELPDLKNFTLLGTQSYEGIARLMQHADCFVLFSNYETFGCVVAESLCAGVPVISTPTGAIPEMINDANGILIQPADEAMLSRTMEKMVSRKNLYDRETIHLQATSRFSYPIIARQFEQIYKKVLSAKASDE